MKDISVLVVEDDTLVQEMVHALLQDLGYTILGHAIDGEQAIHMTGELNPDVVLMDIKMNGMDGIEAARRILHEYNVPVVILSAYQSTDLISLASQAGVGAYLVKPPHPDELERAIIIALARYRDLQELQRLNKTLEARNEELDAFAHTVAHDLKSSMGVLSGIANLIEENYLHRMDDMFREYLQAIVRSSNKMENIIDELLILAEVRQADVQTHPLNMSLIVSEALQRLAYLVDETAVEIKKPTSWPIAVGYGPWIEEVWVNYISNAIKYGGNPGRVELGGAVLPNGDVRFWVQDNGPGLTAEEQKNLFVPFTKLNQIQAKGHGLGLSIVQRIITRLEGQVSIESEKGDGCVFSFTLPGPSQQQEDDDQL